MKIKSSKRYTPNATPPKKGLSASDLPPSLRVFWDTAPEQFRIAAILTALNCYCALGTRIRAKYVYDLEPHALLIQLLVLGEPGSGKSFTRPIVKQLLRPLKLKDIEQKRIEQAYNDLKKTAAKNKQLPEEPITCPRNLQTITRAKLVKRADMFIRKYGEPLAFFFFNEELATMTESNKRAFADLNTMDRLAYDLGAEYGSDTLSDASYNADVDIIYCSLFCGTDNALNEYINKRAIEGGNCTRKILTRIDEDLLGEDAPVFRRQTEQERNLISKTVDRLMDETYTEDDLLQPILNIDMEWIENSVRKWCAEQRTIILKTGSRAHNCFYKRASVSAWRLTCMCYHLWTISNAEHPCSLSEHSTSHPGHPTSHSEHLTSHSEHPNSHPELVSGSVKGSVKGSVTTSVSGPIQTKCIKFYRFMAAYILNGLLAQWGRQYDEMHKHDDDVAKGAVTPLYDQVPNEFTRDQLQELCAKSGLSPARIFLHKWKKAKLIHQKEKGIEVYVKNY